MSLIDIDNKIKEYYNSSADNILKDFYIPVLSESTFYRRITGFFSSDILAAAAKGITQFIKNGGKMELVCWVELSEEDIEAIKKGLSEEDIIEKKLESEININNIEDELKRDHLKVMAWMVKNKILNIKVAVKTDNKGNILPTYKGMFHPKSGLLRDSEGNEICFSGSDNETEYGWLYNIEEFHVYKNWRVSDKEHFKYQRESTNKFWNGNAQYVKVMSFPEALKKKIIKSALQSKEEIMEMNIEKRIIERIKKQKQINGSENYDNSKIKPYYYQEEAIEAWKNSGHVGILSMATGTGKTYTALFAMREMLNKKPVLILVPTVVLLEQWIKNINTIYPDAIILKAGGKYNWKDVTWKQVIINKKSSKKRFVVSTMSTASMDDFIEFMQQAGDISVIVDEVHRIGSPTYRSILERIKFSEILGLSATPERLYDIEGNIFLKRIFGERPVFKIDLGDTIKLTKDSEPKPVLGTILSKYQYHFEIVHLNREEEKIWEKYTKKIDKYMASLDDKLDIVEILSKNEVKRMFMKRAKILKNAQEKIQKSGDILEKYYSEGSRWIVYCDDINQLKQVSAVIKKHLDVPVLEYHSQMPSKKRTEILSLFEEVPSIIVSIRCLDEGVDIPSVDGALILASSKNPREYIQRRGRVLRRARNKEKSIIVDTFVMPYQIKPVNTPIIKGELIRAFEFSKHALNRGVTHQLWNIAFKYGIDINKYLDMGDLGIEEVDGDEYG